MAVPNLSPQKSPSGKAFLTVAEVDGFRLGIWPLVIPENDDHLIFAVRLRAVPSAGILVLDPDMIASAFPNIPFSKKTTEKCSVVLRHPRAVPRHKSQDFILSSRVVRIRNQMVKMIGDPLILSPEQLLQLLQSSYQAQCTAMDEDPAAVSTMILPFPESTLTPQYEKSSEMSPGRQEGNRINLNPFSSYS